MPTLYTAPHSQKPQFNIFKTLFETYVTHPKSIHFKGQHKEEELMLLLRKHWIANVGWVTVSIILAVIPLIGVPFIDIADLFPFPLPFIYQLVGFVFWYIGTFGYILLNFLFWFYNVNIVTTERIVDVDFIYLLYNEISSTVIENIEDVTYKRAGLFGSIFDFGNVFVQTAGTKPNIEFLTVPRPSEIASIITRLIQNKK